MPLTFRSTCEDDTDRLGRALAETLPPGTVVTLLGTLGAGKTRLVRCVAAALGIDPEMVVSPTFVLVREYQGRRVFTADEYVGFCGTHCDHIVIPEPDKSRFFDGLRSAVLNAGNRIEFLDTFVLYLAKKPGG